MSKHREARRGWQAVGHSATDLVVLRRGEHPGEADDEEQEHATKYDWDHGLGCRDLVHSPLSIGLRLITEFSGTAVPSIAQKR